MKKLISEFTTQLNHSLEISERAKLTPISENITYVVISGMGGSGIGGDIVSEAISQEIKIPIIVNKDYILPNYVEDKTLVIISSYSGDTEETVNAMKQAISIGANIVCITSGGKVEELAIKNHLDVILIPKDIPPRAALAYSLVQLLYTLNFHSIISDKYKVEILNSIISLNKEEQNILTDAKETANLLLNKLPIVYSVSAIKAVSTRFCQQLKENSKTLCWHNEFPELNHNELQGWEQKGNNFSVIIFRNDTDYLRTSKRIDISAGIIGDLNTPIKEVYSKGNSLLEKMLYLIHWGDWVSYFLAELKEVDTMDIRVISYLKWELSKVKEY